MSDQAPEPANDKHDDIQNILDAVCGTDAKARASLEQALIDAPDSIKKRILSAVVNNEGSVLVVDGVHPLDITAIDAVVISELSAVLIAHDTYYRHPGIVRAFTNTVLAKASHHGDALAEINAMIAPIDIEKMPNLVRRCPDRVAGNAPYQKQTKRDHVRSLKRGAFKRGMRK